MSLGEAAAWFARLQNVDAGAPEHAQFDAWLLSSPAHIEAFLKVTQAWGRIGCVSEEEFSSEELIVAARAESAPDNLVALHGASPVKVLDRKRPSWRRYASIAAILTLTIAGALLFLRPSPITTVIGEQRSIPLSDGSIAHLNTNSRLIVHYTNEERRLHLSRGEARFTVANNPARPFVVVTPQTRVRALGTVFNVQASREATTVTVIEGEVAVADVKLQKGEHAAVTRQGAVMRDAGPSVERVLAWPQRQLVFREDALADVVAEFNRYHREVIRIEDPTLAGIRISAVFDSSDSASLIQYLEQYRDVRAVKTEEGGVYLFPRNALIGASEKN